MEQWLSSLSIDYLCVHSDGSGSSADKVTWAFVTIAGGTGTVIDQSGYGSIANAEVYDVEIHGAMAALEAIRAINRDIRARATYFLLDNYAVVEALTTGKTVSSSLRVQKSWSMAARAFAPIKVKWIPGRTGLAGNEMADKLARRERTSPNNSPTPTDSLKLAAKGRKSREFSRQLLKDWWDSHRLKRYADFDLKMKRKNPPELALPRAIYARLIAARTGHGDFA